MPIFCYGGTGWRQPTLSRLCEIFRDAWENNPELPNFEVCLM